MGSTEDCRVCVGQPSNPRSSDYFAPLEVLQEPIPELTHSERLEREDNQIKEIFQGEDLSRLDNSRRKRRCSYSSVEELLAAEFEFGEIQASKEPSSPAVSLITSPVNEPIDYKMKLVDDSIPMNSGSMLSEPLQISYVQAIPQPSIKKKAQAKQSRNSTIKASLRRQRRTGESRLSTMLKNIGIQGPVSLIDTAFAVPGFEGLFNRYPVDRYGEPVDSNRLKSILSRDYHLYTRCSSTNNAEYTLQANRFNTLVEIDEEGFLLNLITINYGGLDTDPRVIAVELYVTSDLEGRAQDFWKRIQRSQVGVDEGQDLSTLSKVVSKLSAEFDLISTIRATFN